MKLNVENLKQKYKIFFKNEILDELISEVVFGFSEIEEYIKNGETKSILEVGSGPGMLLSELKKIYPNIKMTGLEPLSSGYDRYQNINENIKKSNNNIQDFNILNKKIEEFNTNEKFDLIFSVNVLAHVPGGWKGYIKSISKLLNPNGISICLCPNYDFPYESNYVIPIIINKKITKFFFKKIIQKHDDRNNLSSNHWESISFISKRKIKKYLNEKNYNFYFDEKIKNRLLKRLSTDKELRKKQGLVANFAIISKNLFLDN